MSTLTHLSTPSTHIISSHPLPTTSALDFLHSFIHWTSSTRPIRNRKHPFNNIPVPPFPASVLTNLRRIEMGMRGEQAPRLVPTTTSNTTKPPGGTTASSNKDASRKRKRGEGMTDKGVTERDPTTGEKLSKEEVEGKEEMEVQAGGREMRQDGEMVVRGKPEVLEAGNKGKESKKAAKKARRKEEKKGRAEKRRKEKRDVEEEDEE